MIVLVIDISIDMLRTVAFHLENTRITAIIIRALRRRSPLQEVHPTTRLRISTKPTVVLVMKPVSLEPDSRCTLIMKNDLENTPAKHRIPALARSGMT